LSTNRYDILAYWFNGSRTARIGGPMSQRKGHCDSRGIFRTGYIMG
jgi:hypothetical protein